MALDKKTQKSAPADVRRRFVAALVLVNAGTGADTDTSHWASLAVPVR